MSEKILISKSLTLLIRLAAVYSWLQAAFVLTTGINSAYALEYSGAIMVPLGWIGGVVGLILATAISLYANTLIAEVHEIGGKRHIRYRDLAGFIYGRKAYHLTWMLQYINLFMINCGFIILAGSALKAIPSQFPQTRHTQQGWSCAGKGGTRRQEERMSWTTRQKQYYRYENSKRNNGAGNLDIWPRGDGTHLGLSTSSSSISKKTGKKERASIVESSLASRMVRGNEILRKKLIDCHFQFQFLFNKTL